MSQFKPFLTPKERCEECGFEYASVSPADAAVALRSFGRRYRAPLTRFLDGEDGETAPAGGGFRGRELVLVGRLELVVRRSVPL